MMTSAAYSLPSKFDVGALANSILTEQSETLNALFTIAGSPPPHLVWSPTLRALRHPVLRSFSTLVETARGDKPVVEVGDLTFEALTPFSDVLMELVPTGVAGELRYTFYGDKIASFAGRNMKGKTTSGFDGHISRFFSAAYIASERRREVLLSEHEPPEVVFVSRWRRLVVPVFEAGGPLSHFTVLNLPDNELRAGLELLPFPILIARDDGSICFANEAMSSLFVGHETDLFEENVETLFGITLLSPQDGLGPGDQPVIQDRVAVNVVDRMLMNFELTIKHVLYRNQYFHLIVALPDLA